MIRKLILDNGIKIITEYMPHTYSATAMVWINAGPEIETPQNNGISHFVEHMVFKGTYSRSAKQIVQGIENTGGSINAFTQKDCTCFYAKTLREHVPVVIDTLLDMIFNPSLNQSDIELERQVILDEIKMYGDTPDELVFDLMLKSFFNNHPLGMPISGTESSLSRLTRADIVEFVNNHYTTNNIIISIAGNFDEDKVIEQIREIIKYKTAKETPRYHQECVITAKVETLNKDIEQSHLCIGTKGLSLVDPDRYALAVIDTCLGSGMGSRLFQKIREDKGLAYCIDTFEEAFKHFGIFGVYVGSNPKNVQEIIKYVVEEFENIKQYGFSDDEIEKAKNQIKGSLLIGQDNPKRRASRNTRSELYYNQILTIEEICAKVDNITNHDVKRISTHMFDPGNIGITLVGPNASSLREYSLI